MYCCHLKAQDPDQVALPGALWAAHASSSNAPVHDIWNLALFALLLKLAAQYHVTAIGACECAAGALTSALRVIRGSRLERFPNKGTGRNLNPQLSLPGLQAGG